MRNDSRPTRRSHDRADQQARNRLVGVAALAAVALMAGLGGYWWYSSQDPARDGAPNWFPDGQALVFAAEVGTGRADIYRMDLDGGGRRRLTDHEATDASPAVSPDGTRIAFESERDGNSEIYVMDVAGGNVVRLTNDPARDSAPAWSPDSRRIAFTSDRDNRASADVYVMNADGSGVERVTTDLANWAPQFAPDGRRLAVQVNRDVMVLDLIDGSRRRLTAEPHDGMNPAWQPDGSRLAFVTTRNRRAEIFTMNADGTDAKVLVTMAAGHVIDPRWSPDGSRVAFVMVPEAVPGPNGEMRPEDVQAIYTIEVASGVVTRLSK
jgi:Tol biopolymer transport system component